MKPLLGLYEKSMPMTISLPEKLRSAKDAGYDYLELSIDETDEKLARLNWEKYKADALLKTSKEIGIPILSICLSGHRRFALGDPNLEIRQKALKIMEDALILASRLEVQIIQIAGYDVYYSASSKETELYFAENLEKSITLATKYGIVLAFETMETPFMDTVEKAARWVKQFPSPFLKIYPDTGNITNAALLYGNSVKDDLLKGAGLIAALHLKESKPGIYREVPYGKGHVNFQEAIETAYTLGTRLYVAEFWYTQGETSWTDTLRKNCIFLKNLFTKNMDI